MTISSSEVEAIRQRLRQANRVVVKAGSSSLTTPSGTIALDRIERLVDVCARAQLDSRHVVLVSSGAIASGLGPLGLAERPLELALAQAAASVGQGELISAYSNHFARYGLRVGQVLLTADDLARRSHFRNAQHTLDRLMSLGVVPIVNENDTVATAEIRMGDNDRLAAFVAYLVNADALLLLTDVDALYDGPPSRPGATRIPVVHSDADLGGVQLGDTGSHVGSGGMRTKVEAARIACDMGIPVVLTHADVAHEALAGEPVGTVFVPTGRRKGIRRLWIEYAADPGGVLVIDDGAVAAVRERNASLLPAGIVDVRGDFDAGQVVELVSGQQTLVARGVVRFGSAELPRLLGRSTRDLGAELGSGYEREVIHRDELVLVRPASTDVAYP